MTPLRTAGAALLLVPGLLAGLPPVATASAPVAGTGACADGEGTTVVVDATDLGGEVTVSCAEGDPTSGREALELAGFTPVDGDPGFICQIDSLPDPCPTTFEGSYWSYWYAESPDAGWTTYQVGADDADPQPGALEGWRYNDGSAGPTVAPAEAAEAAPADEEAAGASDETAASDDASAAEPASEDGGPSTATVVSLVVLALLVAGVVAVLARRRRSGTGA